MFDPYGQKVKPLRLFWGDQWTIGEILEIAFLFVAMIVGGLQIVLWITDLLGITK